MAAYFEQSYKSEQASLTKNSHWAEAVAQLTEQGDAFVLLTILTANGSTPRECGTKMVVSKTQCYGTIGGGHLEFKSVAIAQQLLLKNDGIHYGRESTQHIEHFTLGASLGQCCGGSTSVLFESFAACQTQIMLFGAGHVGRALMPILADLPCNISWVDSRCDEFPTEVARNTQVIISDSPVDEVANMPANCYYLIMTHNHQLDFDLCQAILKRNDFAFLGLIGSQTKWKRFRHRLQHRDFSIEDINKITCPVGLETVTGKRPMEVAVSIAGQIISLYQANNLTTRPEQLKSKQVQSEKPSSVIRWSDLEPLLNK